MFLAYAGPVGRGLSDRELYLLKAWTQERDRCRAAGIGDEIPFATKNELGLAMLQRAFQAQVPFGWVSRAGGDGGSQTWEG